MTISQTEISDYVSGRLDALDHFRFEAILVSDVLLQRAVRQAQLVNDAIKLKFGMLKNPECRLVV